MHIIHCAYIVHCVCIVPLVLSNGKGSSRRNALSVAFDKWRKIQKNFTQKKAIDIISIVKHKQY